MNTAELSILGELSMRLERAADAVAAAGARTQAAYAAIRVIPGIPIPQITTTGGTADYSELLGPRTGITWFVLQAAALTFTAGTVNLYRNHADDSNLVGAFPSAGYLTYDPKGLSVNSSQRLLFAAQAVTGNVTPSLTTILEIADWAVPAYLLGTG